MRNKWLRLNKCTFRIFKKYYLGHLNIDGVRYSFKKYSKFIDDMEKIKVGDLVYNPYTNIMEKVKEVEREWYTTNIGKHVPTYLEITFTTETGYRIYDVNDICLMHEFYEDI
jgi:hypothetical protein